MRNKNFAVFLNYRHKDSTIETGRLRERLVEYWGENTVFMDTEEMEAGTKFPKKLFNTLSTCSVLIAIIGPNWRRWENVIDDVDTDWVVREIAYALDSKHKMDVIPVLVHNTKRPYKKDLPVEIAELAYIIPSELRPEKFETDVKELITTIEKKVSARYQGYGIQIYKCFVRTSNELIEILKMLMTGSIWYFATIGMCVAMIWLATAIGKF